MFHPLFNHNGSVSWFRLVCLVALSLCMLAYAVTMLCRSAPAATTAESRPAVVPSAAATEPAAEAADAARAADELRQAAAFMAQCGRINKGFVGCFAEFTPAVSAHYTVTQEAADDGFFISLTARADDPHPGRMLTYRSGGEMRAFDASGLDVTAEVFGGGTAAVVAANASTAGSPVE